VNQPAVDFNSITPPSCQEWTRINFQHDATMANVPPLARVVLVLMGFNILLPSQKKNQRTNCLVLQVLFSNGIGLVFLELL
jgi:hypothetical protein